MSSEAAPDSLSPFLQDLPDDLRGSFDEPWQAELFALTVELSKAGVFSWTVWVDSFSAEIQRNPQLAQESINQGYYRQWLAALEALLIERDLIHRDEIDNTQEHWRKSYLHTEHGKAVILHRDHAAIGDAHHHDHDHSHDHAADRPVAGPIAVSPATP